MKECMTDKAGSRRRRRKVRGGIDEFVLQLPPDELIEFLREYCGLDEFCLSLIYGDPEAEKEMIHEAPPISMFGEPSRGKSIFPHILRQMLAERSPEERAVFFRKLWKCQTPSSSFSLVSSNCATDGHYIFDSCLPPGRIWGAVSIKRLCPLMREASIPKQ